MRNPAALRYFRSPAASRRKLPISIPPQARVAQVSSPTTLFERARYFLQAQGAELREYGPQVLLGSSEDLFKLAAQVEQRSLNLHSLDRAVFVLTGPRDMPLRDSARAALWQVFGVPVYELLLDGNGSTLAAECEAHEGWHIEGGVTFSTLEGQLWYSTKRGYSGGTGLTGRVEAQPCPCGRTGKRLVHLAMDFQDAVRHRLSA